MQEECSELPAQEVQSPLAGPNNEHGAVPEPLVQQSTDASARASKRSSNAEGESSITRLIPIDEAGDEEKQTHGRPSFDSNERLTPAPCRQSLPCS